MSSFIWIFLSQKILKGLCDFALRQEIICIKTNKINYNHLAKLLAERLSTTASTSIRELVWCFKIISINCQSGIIPILIITVLLRIRRIVLKSIVMIRVIEATRAVITPTSRRIWFIIMPGTRSSIWRIKMRKTWIVYSGCSKIHGRTPKRWHRWTGKRFFL